MCDKIILLSGVRDAFSVQVIEDKKWVVFVKQNSFQDFKFFRKLIIEKLVQIDLFYITYLLMSIASSQHNQQV